MIAASDTGQPIANFEMGKKIGFHRENRNSFCSLNLTLFSLLLFFMNPHPVDNLTYLSDEKLPIFLNSFVVN